MRLIFSPIRMDEPLTANVAGDVLTVNGEALDFGPLPAGATLPCSAIDCSWIAGDVTRDMSGLLNVPLFLPHGANAPHATKFPSTMLVGNGPVSLPSYDEALTNED